MAERYALSITTADGRVLRYGPDEPSADGIPTQLTYSSTIPGGHDQATFNLKTRITDELPFSLLDDVRVYGPGNQTLWEGYVAQLPRQSGDDFLVNVQCVGHSARLKWDTGFREIYVDRDLSKWGSGSITRRIAFNAGAWTNHDPHVSTDATGGAELALTTTGGLTGAKVFCEAVYNSPVPVGKLRLSSRVISGGFASDANYEQFSYLSNDDGIAVVDSSGDLGGAQPLNGYELTATTNTRRFVFLQWYYLVAGTWAAGNYGLAFKPAVYGRHGLTEVGTYPASGFYGHDILADVISRAGSGLTSDITDNTSFIIEQLAFPEPTAAEDAILEVNKYFLYEWGVWDNRTFFWRPADPDRLTWEARMDQGAHLNLEGDESANAINGVVVTFSMPNGQSRTAGPVGSGQDVENATLGDTSADNPVNAHGITRKYASINVSFTTTDAGAIAIGAAYLAQLSLPARKGSINLNGYVHHPTKGLRPVSEVRAGDWIRVTDSANPDVARRIVQASHDADGRSCQLDVGNDIDKVDAILQRVGIATSLVGG